MAAFLTAAEDSQREINHFAYEQEKRPPPTKYRPICFYCGGKLCWDSSGDRSDDDDSVVNFYHCVQCGASYEVYQPNEEEKQDYKEYWRNTSRTKINKEI